MAAVQRCRLVADKPDVVAVVDKQREGKAAALVAHKDCTLGAVPLLDSLEMTHRSPGDERPEVAAEAADRE